MLSKLLRSIGLLAGLGIGLISTVVLPMLLAFAVWAAFARACATAARYLQSQPDTPQWIPIGALRDLSLSAPGPETAATHSAVLFLGTYTTLLAVHALVPMRFRLRGLFSGASPLPMEHPLQQFLQHELIGDNGPRARIWSIPAEGVCAYAVSGPLHGNAIVMSQHVIDGMHPALSQWILAHEYGHIKLGHTHTSTLWLVGIKAIHRLNWLRQRLASLTYRILMSFRLVRLLWAPFWLTFWLLELIANTGLKLGVGAFVIMDRWASRRMELEADAYAGGVCGYDPGIWLFKQLQGAFEPRFNSIFATHPTHKTRADQLEKLKSAEVTPA